ncbi:hypothetical protein I4U23_001415 [Adineta vaga]|nr:hypothetical protein I4U23_001415 [Adineta vaga]
MGTVSSKLNWNHSTAKISFEVPDSSQTVSLAPDIHRLALNQSMAIGSFYDAKSDRFLERLLLEISPQKLTSKDAKPIVRVGKVKDRTLPDIINIDKELFLSVYFRITPANGVALLIQDSFIIDEHTRYLSYYYPTSKESFADNESNIKTSKKLKKSLNNIAVSHVLTEIQYGIHTVMIIQVTPMYASKIDELLETIRNQLIGTDTIMLNENEQELLEKYTSRKIFSNVPDPVTSTRLLDLFDNLSKLRTHSSQFPSIEYTFRPIRSICPWYSEEKVKYISLDSSLMNEIETYLNQLELCRRQLHIPVDSTMHTTITKHFGQQYEVVQEQISKIEGLRKSSITTLREYILEIRRGDSKLSVPSMELPINVDDRKTLETISNALQQRDALIQKVKLICTLEKQNAVYWNVKNSAFSDDVNLQTIEVEMLERARGIPIFCFSDKLKDQFPLEWNEFYKKSNDTQNSNKIIYADFSYCSFELSIMKILTPDQTCTQQKNMLKEPVHDITPSASKKVRLDDTNPLPADNFINLLLLGPSGVGKSTFINAIVNYFHFDTLAKARSHHPIALMPVSFIITEGHHFQERLITFGQQDPNEDHHHPGQSVTQQCRSYVFSISNHTKIRIIDTPGMGDTRGIDQDDDNMQHILSFISNLSHINAVCILLKPNESKLNVVLRSYFTRLLGFLGEKVRENIVFCFTNTRSTFFAPGDTGPLLREMLKSSSIKNIPFEKRNTFCFDSESFRYLIARENDVKFDDYQKQEYEQSWIKSSKESQRLIAYICTDMKCYSKDEWKSIEHAQFEINRMVRPMLETIRNTMRNTIILQKDSPQPLIQLEAQSIGKNMIVCPTGKRRSKLIRGFLILLNEPHASLDPCDRCSGTLSEHFKIDYELKYRDLEKAEQIPTMKEIQTTEEQLKQLIINFGKFFKNVVHLSEKADSISNTLKEIIDEEEYLSSQKESRNFNSYLCQKLKVLRQDYERVWTERRTIEEPMKLPNIYDQIKIGRKNSLVNAQMDAIRKSEELFMKEHEKHIQSTDIVTGKF